MKLNKFITLIVVGILLLSSCTGANLGEKTPGGNISSPTPSLSPLQDHQTSSPLAVMINTPTLEKTITPIPNPEDNSVTLMAVGDLMMGRSIGEMIISKGSGAIFPGVQQAFDTADILVGNLECAISIAGTPEKKQFTLAAPQEAAQALEMAGFDVLNLANNHVMDYGITGLQDTFHNLSDYGISFIGAGNYDMEAYSPVIIERKGLRISFLGFAEVPEEITGFDTHSWIATTTKPGIAWADDERMSAAIRAAKEQSDVMIVMLHSGYEIGEYIQVISPNQREAAYRAIDAGASLVLGSHPHVLQSIERYHTGIIAFSLGNFVFDDYQGIADATIILRAKLGADGVKELDWLPVQIVDGIPQLISSQDLPAIGTLVAP